MSVCSKWSREYGCRCCGDQDACHERGIDPLENATDAELEALDLEPRDKKNTVLDETAVSRGEGMAYEQERREREA